MPYLFTKSGYKKADFSPDSRIISELNNSSWVYGEGVNEVNTSAEREKISQEIKKIYMQEYATHWQHFINSFTISKFQSTAHALGVLSQLADPVYSPLLAVAELTAENTSLTEIPDLELDSDGIRAPVSSSVRQSSSKARELADNVLKKLYQPTSVDLRFEDLRRVVKNDGGRPAQIQIYIKSIEDLSAYLTEIDSSPNPNEASYLAAKERFTGSGSDAIKKLRIKAGTSTRSNKSMVDEPSRF